MSENSSAEEEDDDEEEEEQEEEEEIEEEEVDEEEEDESDEAQGGSSSHHKNNIKNTPTKRPVPAPTATAAPQKPVRFAVDAEIKQKTGVAAFLPRNHPHEYVPPPPAVAAPAPPPTITESRPGGEGEGGGSTIGGAHRPLQRSATLPANPQRNITLQLANKHRIVHFCNAVSVFIPPPVPDQ